MKAALARVPLVPGIASRKLRTPAKPLSRGRKPMIPLSCLELRRSLWISVCGSCRPMTIPRCRVVTVTKSLASGMPCMESLLSSARFLSRGEDLGNVGRLGGEGGKLMSIDRAEGCTGHQSFEMWVHGRCR